MTARQLAYACLELIGEFSLTLTQYPAPADAGVFRAIVRALNEALDELYELNPGIFKREVGAAVRAPETGTVTLTQGSVDVSATTLTGPLASNTILIAGAEGYNAIRLEGASKKLLFPYTGPSGVHGATLYGDSLLLDAAYSQPLGPVWLNGIRILAPLNGKADLLGFDPRQDLNCDWGREPYGSGRFPRSRTIAQPEAYFADTHLLEAGTSQVRIFLTPIPDRAYALRFDAAVRPLPVTVDDIGDDDGDADPNRNFPLPAGKDHHFLLPLVLYYWSRSAFVKNEEARRQIAADRADRLPEIESYKIQPQTGGRIVNGGWK